MLFEEMRANLLGGEHRSVTQQRIQPAGHPVATGECMICGNDTEDGEKPCAGHLARDERERDR